MRGAPCHRGLLTIISVVMTEFNLTFKLSRENNNVSDLMGSFETPDH